MAQTTPQVSKVFEATSAATLFCPHCRASYPLGSLACTNCGAVISPTGYTRNGGLYLPPKLPVRVVQQPRLEHSFLLRKQTEKVSAPRRQQVAVYLLGLVSIIVVLIMIMAVLTHRHSSRAGGTGDCRIECSPTYTVPPQPTGTPLPPFNDPRQPAQAFINIYDGTDIYEYPYVAQLFAKLFDSAYANVPASTIACAALNMKETYGGIINSSIEDPIITDTVALVNANVLSVSYSGGVSFYLKLEGDSGWRIDRITGWIGGDITPDNPVGDSQSCLALTPTPQSPSR